MSHNIAEIVALARQQIELEKLIEVHENSLKALKEELRSLSEEAIPLAMIEAGGLSKIVLDTGETVEVKPDFVCGIPKGEEEQAFDWLEKHGYGGLIRTTVVTAFGKGELPKAQKLIRDLAKQDLSPALNRTVPWQTLKAFIVESTRATRPIPLELFGAHPLNRTVIKSPKEGKE